MPLDNTSMDNASELMAVQIQCKPDFEFMEANKLMNPTDFNDEHALLKKLFLLCAAECQTALKGAKAVYPHLEKYRAWIDDQVERARKSGHPVIENSAEIFELNASGPMQSN